MDFIKFRFIKFIIKILKREKITFNQPLFDVFHIPLSTMPIIILYG
jgi:hypothetical protein